MRKYILLYTGLLLSVSGCSLLELDESTGLDREEAYSYFSNVKGLATYVYSQLPGDLGVLDGALRESATDNSVYVWSDNSVHDFYNNAWSPNNAVDNMWSKCYGAIRSVNSFLENYSQEKLERFRWNDTYEEDIAKATMYREELRVLRASLLYAASLLHNPAQDADKWKAAADAAYAIIKENWYSLPKTNVDPLYDKNGGNDVLKSPQLIFERRNGESFDFEANNLPISYEKGKTGNVPTQNLVDAFQMTNGKDFDWEQITPGQNPYEGRDPRFYKTVLCNGDTWMNSTIQSYEGGKDGAGTTGATTTGYYLKKYMNETVSLAPSNEKKKPHHFIIFRYAEILLNYAEAMDAWKDADYTDNDHPLSARAALNQVRAAADMPAITTSGDAFTESVRRERRVELAFEDHRFWDIRRWKIGDKTKAIYCIKITMENGLPVYKKELLETRNWDDKMYLYPIPQTEYYKNPNLGQNTGW